jgi:hypothetical protein
MNHRHGHRGGEAGRQRRRRQLRWNSDQRCAIGSKRTRRRSSGLTWQRLRRKLMVRMHAYTRPHHCFARRTLSCNLRTSQARYHRVHKRTAWHGTADVCSQSAHKYRHTLHCCNCRSNGELTPPARGWARGAHTHRCHKAFLTALVTAARRRATAAAPESEHTTRTCS